MLESGKEFGDTGRVILAGDSAGGNIVAVMAQRLLSENVNLPKLQVLIYPWMQMVIALKFFHKSNFLYSIDLFLSLITKCHRMSTISIGSK